MKIALVAPIALPVPPEGYGGTELVISMLAEGLVARGHEVTLFASGDSHTSGALRARMPHALEALYLQDKAAYMTQELLHVSCAFGAAAEFDLIHDHTKIAGTLMAHLIDTPCLTTVHNDFLGDRREVYGTFPDHAYVSISRAHAARMPELNFLGTVYNGLDLGPIVYRDRKEDYLLFLGRLDRDKGAHTAARIASELDWPLIMAGRLADRDRPFFEAEVQPYLDGVKRRYIGEVTGKPKWELYAGARALLFPIQWPEPFGLVMIEAMAAGTPVVATRWGSVPEVVAHGETGMLVDSQDDFEGLVRATLATARIAPRACRAHVERRFSADKMVEDYLKLYEALVAGARVTVSQVSSHSAT